MKVAAPTELMWALIGLILTIGGTFLEAFIASPPWAWGPNGFQAHSLGVTYQIGAVLLVGCLGGKNAGAIAQIAYLLLGLTWFDIFANGGGFEYIYQPTFGYLLGFIPGAWVCGYFAFRILPRLESLTFSCICGLLTVHVTGLSYLLVAYAFNWVSASSMPLFQAILTYSILPIPGQLAIVCAVAVISYALRRVMFY